MKPKLRVCASCEWIFKETDQAKKDGCPKCGFAHYSAKFVYGRTAYKYQKTQQPWLDRKVANYKYTLLKEIEDSKETIEKNETKYMQKLFG